MKSDPSYKIVSVLHLFERLPENERLIVDVLRQIITENLPSNCKEKLAFNVPFFYGNRGICIIWPATIPRGGIQEGVLLGFWQGNKLNDEHGYLTHGTNKKVFYKKNLMFLRKRNRSLFLLSLYRYTSVFQSPLLFHPPLCGKVRPDF